MARLALVTGARPPEDDEKPSIGFYVAAQLRAAGWDVLAPTRGEMDFSGKSKWTYQEPCQGPDDRLDALIFCHGTWYSQPLSQHNFGPYTDQFVLRVGLPFDFYCFMWKALHRAGGCVVMVASTQAFGGRAETGPYGAACAAQVRLMQGLAQSKDGIRYNAVCPGLTDTDLGKQVRATGDCRPDAVPQPPDVVAAAVVGLVMGDENGVILRVVDGETTRARWVWE